MEIEKKIENGVTKYYKQGTNILHREDKPAIEFSNGTKKWYLNGKLHRENKPAIEYANGNKEWYLNGKLHRENKPAIEYANGNKEWYLNGKLHRENGPAIEYANGNKEWYYINSGKILFLKGKRYSETEFQKELLKNYQKK